ncbi:hypothetical protein E1267_10845 [Nonomuraea longispora]|uniref:Uncharacterized protein n=1 Tax=Nonomuraea longispora TaxID=1848320 RepID=A0A4R4NGV6_9ACTN|nr:hypothetical protein [Nonomuraea longispora]TDC08249.1 hypothetical protein E1267_10845 [Nonomuraea longispora]
MAGSAHELTTGFPDRKTGSTPSRGEPGADRLRYLTDTGRRLITISADRQDEPQEPSGQAPGDWDEDLTLTLFTGTLTVSLWSPPLPD